jgi:outer membrane receptor protein involved in Fe transport
LAGAIASVAGVSYAADADVSEIVVTGSRIVRQDFVAISPVTTVGAENIQATGTLTVETLLNELPQIVPGNTRTSNNAGGEDFATVDLRGLGPGRTLVLVNGERVPASSTTGVVDLNTIPASLISRVEVVTGGASAVYGSDAVAGVVNFILKDNFEGAELNISYGSSFDGKQPEYEINGAIGGDFANGRGNIAAFASYYSRDKVGQSEFDYSKKSAALFADANGNYFVVDTYDEANKLLAAGGSLAFSGGSSTPAWGVIPSGQGFQNLATLLPAQFGAGTYDTNCDGVANTTAFNTGNLTFDPTGKLSPSQTSGACAVPSGRGDRTGIRGGSTRYNYAPDNYLITPAERINFTTILTYDITDDIKAKVNLNLVNTTQEVQLAPTPAGPGTEITVTPTPAMLSYIQSAHPDLYTAIQGRTNPAAPFKMYRRFNEVGTRNAFNENNAYYLLATVDGKMTDTWSWSITGSYGTRRFDSRGTNSVNSTALNQGLAGCQTAAGASLGSAALPGCVTLDVFGEGTLNKQMVDFIRVNTFSSTDIEESRISGFIRGNAFELPAGPVAVVLGAEYRESSANFRVDNEQRTGNIKGFNATQDQSGTVDVGELYGEIAVPLLKDVFLAQSLGIEAGYRFSDYSSIGGTTTYKIGLNYAPISSVRIRGIYNKAVRAPNVFELFQAGDQGFPSYSDPCATTATRVPTPATLAFCSAKAGGFNYTGYSQPNAQVQAFAFGNPDLLPEEAETYTAGIVFQPETFVLGNIKASVDYYNIKITDAIGALGASFYISQCYTGQNLTSEACQRIVRDPATGNMTSVNTSRGNISEIETAGYDVQVDYTLDFDALNLPGRLNVNELFSYMETYTINGAEQVGYNNTGVGGASPDWKSVLSATYSLDDWQVFARWSYTPTMKSATWDNDLPAASFVDVSARWNVNDRIQLTGVIGNLMDERPQQISEGLFAQANTDVQLYRVLGRTFQVKARLRF